MAGEEYIFKIFPRRLRELLERSGADPGEIQELRLRAGRPLFIICGETEPEAGWSILQGDVLRKGFSLWRGNALRRRWS